MAVRTKEEILNSIRGIIGDNTDDESLAIIEDISDTMNTLSDAEHWKSESERIDREWRKKYHDRFFNPSSDPDIDPLKPVDPEPKKLSYDDLFK